MTETLRIWFAAHRMSVLVWLTGSLFTAVTWLFIAIGFGFNTPANALARAVQDRNRRIDSLAAVVDTVRTTTNTLRGQIEANAVIIRAVGVDMCQHKSDEFLAQTAVPCDRLLSNLRPERPVRGGKP